MDLDLASGFQELTKNMKFLRILVLALGLPFVFIFIVATIIPWQATFSVKAQTGYIEVVTTKEQKHWMLEEIQTSINSNMSTIESGIITIHPNVKIVFQSLFKGGVYIQIKSIVNSETVIATFENSKTGETNILKGGVEFIFPSSQIGHGYYLPLEGQWKLGNVLHSQTTINNPILNQGIINVFGDALFSDNRFQAMSAELEPGDQVHLEIGEKQPVIGYGFVNIKSDSEMLVQYHAEADRASIKRFGSNGYTIEATIWNRLTHDPILKVFSNFLSTWVPTVLLLLLMYVRWKSSINTNSKKLKKKKSKK